MFFLAECWLDPGRAAALTRGSALGIRVQQRALFVQGGVLVPVVCY
jgi:hypothetical protein